VDDVTLGREGGLDDSTTRRLGREGGLDDSEGRVALDDSSTRRLDDLTT
jgi:hypothetical protein